MLARSYSAGLLGVDGYVVTVEADVRVGLPGLTVVGRALGAMGETRERVRSAIAHCGHAVRPRRQVVNLAPAERRKESPGLDLAVAAALLASHEIVADAELKRVLLWGELGLDGVVRPVSGTLVVADCARQHGFEGLVVPLASAREAAMISGLKIFPVESLAQLVAQLRGDRPWSTHRKDGATEASRATAIDADLDLCDVQGQGLARLGAEVMVAGGHNLLLHGPPGVGKTMIARRVAGLFPALEEEAALEVTKIHSVARRDEPSCLIAHPPVRMPHHSVTMPGLLGGGHPVRPGEVSLAHCGVLFLDELPEFSRACLEGLREPLEEGTVSIVRASERVRFPARFQLLAAMNPCPCGYLGHPKRACTDPLPSIQRYQQRLSGPLLDRIDVVVPMAPSETHVVEAGDSSASVRARVLAARRRQKQRFSGVPWQLNAHVPADARSMKRWCAATDDAHALLRKLASVHHWSLRTQHRVLRVARTLADLQQPESCLHAPLTEMEVACAAQLRRPLPRNE